MLVSRMEARGDDQGTADICLGRRPDPGEQTAAHLCPTEMRDSQHNTRADGKSAMTSAIAAMISVFTCRRARC